MTDSLKVVPTADPVSTGVRNTESLAHALADVLADTYRLLFKTHAIHWNVEGPLFYSVHNLTEAQYKDLFEAADDLAERIRALGHLAPARLEEITDRSRVHDVSKDATTAGMIEQLASDHEKLAHRLHALIELAGTHKDPVTEDLATARSAFHEKAAWMLRSLSKS
ncbi:Dps family protein [Mameliella sediminis]|uniref:Dps family protein n=1 Tax=Mameliella sediminis TaxID=2836866 RepID=UPI001C4752B4|nr:DNA starvation/stationary phase protection protein [Mameliella sediminis]MBY6112947.1 DNA starvation/stationary phase protection protein [Antarctobacter heliothermus]MBY6143705.1 DNA starvation/stationary phase protection protein [Mameliella alba]MBV7394229.1 DNA starvation/stationary phase protection protein [Mameliella sediminis]MBY6162359.1 DNA starvation/stationary phase protection protein [Mameliella alba]MBY6170833.1 DNA starvation/stationary phase protection protein [Mameliella alba]